MDSVSPRAVSGGKLDSSNQLLSRFHRQRLDAEQIRDAVLALSGQLDLSIGGKTIPLRNRQFVFNHTSVDHTKYDSVRRAIYLPIVRNNLYTFFTQFDFPDPTMPTGNRATTTIAPQALIMLNSDLISNAAKGWAQRLLDQESDVDSRIDLAHQMAYSRPATAVEIKRIVSFLNEIRGSDGFSNREDFGELAAWSMVCQSLFASNEFIYLR